MTASKTALKMEQGATFTFYLQWRGPKLEDGTLGPPRDLTGWTARMVLRDDSTSAVHLSLTETAGIAIGQSPTETGEDPTNGWLMVKITDEQTAAFEFKSTSYQLNATSPGGDTYRLLQGKATITGDLMEGL